MKNHIILIPLALILLFTSLTFYSACFLIPLCISMIGLPFLMYFNQKASVQSGTLDKKIREIESNLNNLQLSLKLQKRLG